MTAKTQVYVRLLDEGVAVSRPACGIPLREGVFRLEATEEYDPDDEVWEYPPGTVVRCEVTDIGGERVLLAVARAE